MLVGVMAMMPQACIKTLATLDLVKIALNALVPALPKRLPRGDHKYPIWIRYAKKILVEEGKKIDKDTQLILDYNQMVQNDQRVENVILPIRDGLMLARKL